MLSRYFIAFLALFLSVPLLLVGQQTAPPASPISVSVLSGRVAVGEFGTLIYKVAANNVALPDRIEAEGVEITYSGNQSSVIMNNGVQKLEFNYFYRFRGNTPGTYTIPSITIQVANQPVETLPIEVTIYERDSSDNANATRPQFAKLELAKNEFYINEIVPFTVTAYVRGRNAINEIVSPSLNHESFIIKNFREVNTNGTELGNNFYSSATMPSTFFALKSGDHKLGPAQLGVRVMESGSGFGLSAFFSRTSIKQLATNTITTKVKALPDGAPASFTGGVGKFELSAQPSITDLSLGDPISVDFEVRGIGNLRTMAAPIFTGTPDIWKSYEASKTLNDDEDSDGIRPGRVLYSQVIIPEDTVTEIPPFELTYFDPQAESYVTLRSNPVPITVKDDGRSSSFPEVTISNAGASTESPAAAERPTAAYDDMLHIRTAAPRWLAEAGTRSPRTLFYIIQGILALAFLSILTAGATRWYKAHQFRSNASESPATFRQALKQIPKAGSSKRDFYHAVSTALSLWLKENPEAPTAVQEVIDKVSSRCDVFLYSGENTSGAPIAPDEARELQSILRRL